MKARIEKKVRQEEMKEYRLMHLIFNKHGEVIQGDLIEVFYDLTKAKQAFEDAAATHEYSGYSQGCHGGYAVEYDRAEDWAEYVYFAELEEER